MIVVNDALRVAYVPIPKVASSAIRGAVCGMPGEAGDYITFAFVRHPWDRLVSALYSVLRSFAPLDERMELLASVPAELMDVHVRPQACALNGRHIDFLGRFDRLEEDWRRLQCIVALPDLQHTNVGRYRPVDWREAPIDWERWYPLYRGDFELCDWSR